jgi:hypothetical protein
MQASRSFMQAGPPSVRSPSSHSSCPSTAALPQLLSHRVTCAHGFYAFFSFRANLGETPDSPKRGFYIFQLYRVCRHLRVFKHSKPPTMAHLPAGWLRDEQVVALARGILDLVPAALVKLPVGHLCRGAGMLAAGFYFSLPQV